MKKIILLIITVSFGCAHKAPPQWVEVKNSYVKSERESFSDKFSVASQGPATSLAAKKIFEMGGNIIDATVAASFVISVERPQSTGLGGGGFILFHNAKENKTYAVDFRERAPLSAFETMFLDEKGNIIPNKSSTGIYSVGVPGLVAGLSEIHQKWGKLPWDKLIEPAIELAEKGFPVYPHLANSIESQKEKLLKSDYAKSIFYHSDGTPLKVGETLIQKDLAKTLRTIQKEGKNGFYKGWVAKAILQQEGKYKTLSQKDFDTYKVNLREPVEGKFKGYKIVSMPPPSSGGTHIIQILQMLENVPLKDRQPLDPKNIHQVTVATQKAFMDRSKYMGDSDFNQIPLKMMLSEEYAQQSRKNFDPNKATHSSDTLKDYESQEQWESTETSHFSLMDAEGNAVGATETINGHFGSGIVVKGTGIVLNNEMEDFTMKPGQPNAFGVITGKLNSIAPNKRPLSSMSPTIVFTPEQKPYMVLGTADGTRIISCVAQTLLNDLEYGMPLFDSVSTLRYHHQWFPDEILVESPGFSQTTQKKLEEMGYKINSKGWFSCKIQAIKLENGKLHGVSDIRGEGLTIGN